MKSLAVVLGLLPAVLLSEVDAQVPDTASSITAAQTAARHRSDA